MTTFRIHRAVVSKMTRVRCSTNQKKRLKAVCVRCLVIDLLIITFCYAITKPLTVMVVLDDAVVTDVAVGASKWSEDVARVTEFELKEHRGMGQATLQVEDPRVS